MYWYEHRAKKTNKNGFEEDFFKLISNSVSGKIMENVWKRRYKNRKKEETVWYQN